MAGPIVVLGAGGHAKVVIEILRARGHDVVGVLDADPIERSVVGAMVVGDDSSLAQLRAQGVAQAFIAIGDNALRLRLAATVRDMGYDLPSAVSPGAVISPSVRIGQGAVVMAGAVVNAEAVIGDMAVINTGALIDHDVHVGEGAHIAPGCVLAGGVKIGRAAFVGAGVTVIPGIKIGAGAVIGAGACVVRDIAGGMLALGVPATVVRGVKQ